jgi:hypothetical protein
VSPVWLSVQAAYWVTIGKIPYHVRGFEPGIAPIIVVLGKFWETGTAANRQLIESFSFIDKVGD